MNTAENSSNKSIPNNNTKKFGIYVNNFYEKIEKDCLTFRRQIENYEWKYIEFESRDKKFLYLGCVYPSY